MGKNLLLAILTAAVLASLFLATQKS